METSRLCEGIRSSFGVLADPDSLEVFDSIPAMLAGISVSEYMRRLFFGGRPIIARTDDQTIRELRRLGGLLKHHFDMVKRTGSTGTLVELDAALRQIRQAIETLSEKR